jgi:hypothetical protein
VKVFCFSLLIGLVGCGDQVKESSDSKEATEQDETKGSQASGTYTFSEFAGSCQNTSSNLGNRTSCTDNFFVEGRYWEGSEQVTTSQAWQKNREERCEGTYSMQTCQTIHSNLIGGCAQTSGADGKSVDWIYWYFEDNVDYQDCKNKIAKDEEVIDLSASTEIGASYLSAGGCLQYLEDESESKPVTCLDYEEGGNDPSIGKTRCEAEVKGWTFSWKEEGCPLSSADYGCKIASEKVDGPNYKWYYGHKMTSFKDGCLKSETKVGVNEN